MIKYVIIALLLMVLLSACSKGLSDAEIISYVAPDLVVYDKKVQKKAAKEMQQYCAVTPTVCMMMTDYKVVRDQIRINKGE